MVHAGKKVRLGGAIADGVRAVPVEQQAGKRAEMIKAATDAARAASAAGQCPLAAGLRTHHNSLCTLGGVVAKTTKVRPAQPALAVGGSPALPLLFLAPMLRAKSLCSCTTCRTVCCSPTGWRRCRRRLLRAAW